MSYNLKEINDLARNRVNWHKQNGLFYSKAGKGIEHSCISKRKPSGYGAGCSIGNKFICREKSKQEVNELYAESFERK